MLCTLSHSLVRLVVVLKDKLAGFEKKAEEQRQPPPPRSKPARAPPKQD